jgi:hypothetical protein
MISLGEFISGVGAVDDRCDLVIARIIDDEIPLSKLSTPTIGMVASRIKLAYCLIDLLETSPLLTAEIMQAGTKFVEADRIIKRAQARGSRMDRTDVEF